MLAGRLEQRGGARQRLDGELLREWAGKAREHTAIGKGLNHHRHEAWP